MGTIPRLLYGFLSQSTDPINLVVPWQISDRDGAYRMNYTKAKAVETNLRVWAKTNRGDRPMRFDYGLDAIRMLFEPETITKDIILTRAREQLSRYFGFLKIVRLEVLTNGDDSTIPDNTVKFVLEASFKDENEEIIKISEDIGI